MLRVLGPSTIDWRLIALAALVCTVTAIATIGLVSRAKPVRGTARASWIVGALLAVACGLAATYFILFGVHSAPTSKSVLALSVATVAISFLCASILVAFMAWRFAEKTVLLDAALTNMNHGLMMFDKNSRVILCNQRYIDLYHLPAGAITPGLTLREVIDRRIAAGTFEGDAGAYCAQVLGAVERRRTSKAVTSTPDGRVIEVVGEPMAGGGWVATHQDLTDERRRESSFRFLFESNPLPMWVWEHATLRILAVNKAAEEKYGYDRDRFLTLTLRDIKRSQDYESIDSAVRGDDSALRKGQITVHAKADGSLFDVELYGRSIVYEGRPASVVCLVDITERKHATDELRNTREFFNTILENVPSSIAVKNADDMKYIFVNRAAEQQFGMKREQVIGKTVQELLPQKSADVIGRRDRELLASGKEQFYDTHAMAATERGRRYITSRRVLIRDEHEHPRYVLNVVDDVTGRKQQDDELRRTRNFLDTIIDNMPAMLLVKGARDLRYVLANRAAEEVYGLRSEEMIGKTAEEVFPAQSKEFIAERDRALLDHGEMLVVDEQPFETRNGTRLLSSKKLLVRDEDGQPQYILSLSEDITDRKRARDQIAYMALHDSLTDVPNRAAFNEKLAATLASATSTEKMFAVLSIDLDRFKEINDVLGHAAGDTLLGEIARRLGAAAGGAFLARLGGDEFVLIADGDPSAGEALAGRLLEALSAEFECGEERAQIGMSIGIAVYPADGKDATALLANANAALYRAKAEGRGTIRFFEAHMDERLRDRRALQHELHAAIEQGELAIHYQPQARIGGGIIGFEALARWHHPNRGVIPPSTFIPLAEESGLIVPMSKWILREVCREAATWPKPLQVAVNLSPVQFRDGDLPGTVHGILLDTGLAPDRLELEVTEGVLINDFARAVSILRRLKLLGVHIAMDDFGTGYSSLSYLQSFPFDKIKIDRTFIANLTDNHSSATIVRAVIGLGRGLHLPVMAEGVETAEQLAFLAREFCDEVQGFYVGRPASIENYADVVGRKRAPVLKVVSG